MKSVRGKYNGSVVVLEEPVPVDHEVEVTVQFPEMESCEAPSGTDPRQAYWEEARLHFQKFDGSAGSEVEQQRRME